MQTELGRITIPGLPQKELELARTLVVESADPRVRRVCKALLDLEPKLERLPQQVRKVFEGLEQKLNKGRRK